MPPRLARVFAIVALWCLQGLVFAQEIVDMARTNGGQPFTWSHALWLSFLALVPCMVPLTVGLVAVVERFPLVRGEHRRTFAALLAAVVAFVVLRAVYVYFMNPLVNFYDELPSFGAVVLASFKRNFLLGWVVVGLAQGWFLAERAQLDRLRIARLEEHVTQARLDALSAQLNPHFLFNVLNSVAELVHRDAAATERMILSLSQLLRRSLTRAQGSEVTVAEELALVQQYVDIEKIRLGARLTVHLTVDAAARQALLPPFLLQPLVENAIVHGVARRRAPGEVRLDVHAEGGRLRIAIEADQAPAAATVTPRGHGIGLGNLRERLQCLYPDAWTLDATFPPQGRSRVRLSLPLRQAPAAARSAVAETA